MFHTSSPRALRWTAAAFLAALAGTSCDMQGEPATIPVDRAVGNWRAESGATVSLAADHTFTSTRLTVGGLADTGCPGGRGSGDWAFFAHEGGNTYSASSEKTKSGSKIGLSFSSPSDTTCWMDLTVVDNGKSLCATDDPDMPCGLNTRFTRSK
ncbi:MULTISPECIES: hypothetical protein [unclassified Streptomyces]|uniref:hypothetical protein n=1 Tax=unclassified Streptomyces TaxID=2593676 RepID=UPI00278C5AE2|nr:MULTISPECIES: hypothetical protein [unclassified Streptomyces]